jgi:hypothetical protein
MLNFAVRKRTSSYAQFSLMLFHLEFYPVAEPRRLGARRQPGPEEEAGGAAGGLHQLATGYEHQQLRALVLPQRLWLAVQPAVRGDAG